MTSIPVASIVANRHQPRQVFDDAALEALAASIRTAGLMQPILVRPLDDGGVTRYELVAGERRWRAVRKLGLDEIPAIVRRLDHREAAEWALIENLQREDLNPMERARAFQRLIQEFGLTHAELAEQVGVDRSSVSNFLRLNDLDAETAACVERGQLSLGHAKALLGCPEGSRRAQLAAEAIRHGWSVRQTEARVRSTQPATRRAPSAPRSAHLELLERQIGEHLGTRVRIEPGSRTGTGRLVIEYFSLEQFEGVLTRFGFQDGDGRP